MTGLASLVAVGAALLSLSACGAASGDSRAVLPRCEDAWNAPENEENRALIVESGGGRGVGRDGLSAVAAPDRARSADPGQREFQATVTVASDGTIR